MRDILIKYIGVKSFNYIAVGPINQNIKGTGIVVRSRNYIINEPNAWSMPEGSAFQAYVVTQAETAQNQ